MTIDGTNDGPSSKYEKKEQIKLVLDMSNDGPMFKMLESMLRQETGLPKLFKKPERVAEIIMKLDGVAAISTKWDKLPK